MSLLNIADINSDAVKRRFWHSWKLFVGTGREYSYKEIEELTRGRISSRTAAGLKREEFGPDLATFYIACAVIGPEFINKMFEPVGVSGCYEVDAIEAVTPQILATQVSRTDYLMTKFLEDGIIDHNEWPELDHELDKLIAVASSLKAMRRKH